MELQWDCEKYFVFTGRVQAANMARQSSRTTEQTAGGLMICAVVCFPF